MASTRSPKVLRDALRGFMRIHVLHHAAKEPIFGLEMIAELKRHGYVVGPGTLYPLLHSLEEARFLRSSRTLVAGRLRKYYRTTKAGDVLLGKLRAKISELVREVLDGHDALAKRSQRARRAGGGPRRRAARKSATGAGSKGAS